jgi:PAS domain S-box-containing protein
MRNFKIDQTKTGLKKEIEELRSEIEFLKSNKKSLQTDLYINGGGELFHSIFEESGIGMALIDSDANIISTNKSFSDLFGYEKGELKSLTYLDLIPEEKRQNALHFINALFSSELSKYQAEHRYIKKDQSIFCLKLTATVINDENGNPKYILGMGEDITEFKRQEKIRDVVNNISSAVNYTDNLNDLIHIIKSNLKTIIDAEHFYITLYNEIDNNFSVPYTVNNRETFKTFPAEKSLVDYVRRNKESSILNYKEILELQAEKEIFIAGKLSKQWIGVPLLIEDRVIGIMGVQSFDNESAFDINDLTALQILSNQISTSIQKMRSENALQIEKAYFKELFDNSPEAIAIVNNSSEIININSEFSRLFGYSKEEALNKSIEDLISIPSLKQEALNLTKEIAKGQIVKAETKRRKKDGTTVNVSLWGTPVVINEGQLAIYAIFRDITDKIESEQKLKAAKEKAEESDKLKTAFLTNMSHEVRTPLNAIVGFSDLLADPNTDIESRNEFVKQINLSSDMLIKLMDNIIDISQIDAGELKISNRRFNVSSLLSELYEKIQDEKSKELKDHIEILLHNPFGDHIAFINSDEIRFKQILEQLLSNALKYTHKGFIEFGFDIDQFENPTFYVRDTGIGIADDKKQQIFDHFTKIEDRSNLYRGTGIGLTITQKLVNLLGGKIWIESHPGIGSIFYFSLPNKIELLQSKAATTKSFSNYNWNGKSILIAEDEDSNYEVLKATLSRTYADLTRVKQGDEAIEHCKNNNYDIVLMDIKMPVMDGINATIEIKKIKPSLPIIAQTAYVHKDERDTCLKSGFDEYIPKPIKSFVLLDMISKLIT